MINQDVKKINKTLEEGDNGFLLSFPPPPSGAVKPKDIYKYEFDITYRLPLDPLSSVEFTPSISSDLSKASYLSSSINSNINIGISIKSIHKAETQTLARLRIKDIYNNLLYTDYILIICSPQKRIQLTGQILSRFGTASLGPNGGRILRINNQTSADLISQLLRRMKVEGPGIPTNQTITISSFIQGTDGSDIELLPYFDINDTVPPGGTYIFSITTSCLSADDLTALKFNNKYIILDKTNNWSYSFKERPIIQFIPNSGLQNDDTAIMLNIKNFDALIGENTASSIPSISYLYGAGRTYEGSICINGI